jgi:U3 small nucleolar RNA-associated protein 7
MEGISSLSRIYNVLYTSYFSFSCFRHLLIGGRKGHVATFDCQTMNIGTELQLQEDVFDVQYLQNESMFAVAQKKCVYIYDRVGVEIHCMRGHERPLKLDYLPYHFLLTSVSHSGWIKWHDISIGEYVAGYQTGFGPCRIMKQNPNNAVMHLGHSNGVVSLWSPNSGKPLVSMLCHRAAVTDLAIDREGHYMATTGLDGYLKIWDIRKFQYLHSFKLDKPANALDISERGCLAVAEGRKIQILRNAFTRPYDVTYLQHEIRTPNAAMSHGGGITASTRALLSNVMINSLKFRPLEDVLCVGHSHGITSLIVPGAGEPNYDSFENNPFLTTRQRREAEVQNLLNKLSSDMIVLSGENNQNVIGEVDTAKTLKSEQDDLLWGNNKKDKEDGGEKKVQIQSQFLF